MADNKTRIKLCGLMCEADFRTAVSLQPDYIGFILSPPFRRYADPVQVRRWRENMRDELGETAAFPQVVGVFVDEEPPYVIRQLQDGVIDIAQLHGAEDDNYIRQIQEMTDRTVVKAIKVITKADVERATVCPADYILLDAGTGEGQPFNWELAAGVGRDYFLAGGLSPENVAEAVMRLRPFAVDVSSGIEQDGHKDPERMRAFVRAVRDMAL